MKALTIWQPWASLVIAEMKPFEFRRWDYRSRFPQCEGQRIVIHAGARPVKPGEVADLIVRLKYQEGAGTALKPDALPLLQKLKADGCKGITAAGLGTVILGKPRRCTELFSGQVADSDRVDEHMWAWPMLDVKPFEAPVPCKGHQGFWDWSFEEAA